MNEPWKHYVKWKMPNTKLHVPIFLRNVPNREGHRGKHQFMLCLVAQPCPMLFDPTDCSPPGSSVHGGSPGKNTGVGCHALLQAELSWAELKLLSRVRLFATPWTVAYQAPPSMGFFRQEYWSGLPVPSPRDLPNRRIKPRSPALRTNALPSELLILQDNVT